MNIIDIIKKKRGGEELSRREIDFFINGYTAERLPDYQIAALLMAITIRGMTEQETVWLTESMIATGEVIDLGDIPGMVADKHSTGGVADTTTLVLAPLVAACGGRIGKMSGRGLGHTGGTIDKLESIPGFQAELSIERFKAVIKEAGLSVIAQSSRLVPADKKLYALRDVTATVESIPLIAASIMSKKLACGCRVIVLDVKTGSGAFIKTIDEASLLAETMVRIGKNMGRKTSALLTCMDKPLGLAIGNSLEVKEAINLLSGNTGSYAAGLKTVSLELAAQILVNSAVVPDKTIALEKLEQAITDHSGLARLALMVKLQGGDARAVYHTELLPAARTVIPIPAPREGYLAGFDAEKVGHSALLLGAGRQSKNQAIDPAVGIILRKQCGDFVKTAEIVAELHVNNTDNLKEAKACFRDSIKWTREKVEKSYIYRIIS